MKVFVKEGAGVRFSSLSTELVLTALREMMEDPMKRFHEEVKFTLIEDEENAEIIVFVEPDVLELKKIPRGKVVIVATAHPEFARAFMLKGKADDIIGLTFWDLECLEKGDEESKTHVQRKIFSIVQQNAE